MSDVEKLGGELVRLSAESLRVLVALQKERDALKADLRLHRDKAEGDYWVWQGDGTDHPESLSVPALIHPQDLMKLVKQAEAFDSLRNAVWLFRDQGVHGPDYPYDDDPVYTPEARLFRTLKGLDDEQRRSATPGV